MAVKVLIMPSAERDLSGLDKSVARRIAQKLQVIEREGRIVGEVRRLTGQPPRFRLRVGDYRILFRVEMDKIMVYRISHRREAYE